MRGGGVLSARRRGQLSPRRCSAEEGTMKDYPVVTKLLCVALVVSVMVPAGRMAFPFLTQWLDNLEFSAVEAVVSTTLGFGLYAALFG
jgi:hypothetical protein